MYAPEKEKQEMIELIGEIRTILVRMPNIKAEEEKIRTAERLAVIKEKMREFRRKYPYD